jgi:hypothetical protein
MKITEYVDQLLECVCAALADKGQGPVCWCGVFPAPDAVSADYCVECDGGACGMGYIAMAEAFPYTTFPFPDFDPTCAKPIAWALDVGVWRCMPVMETDGSLPPAADVTDATYRLLLDQVALFCAITDCDLPGIKGIEQWNPASGGGCAGGSWRINVDPNG